MEQCSAVSGKAAVCDPIAMKADNPLVNTLCPVYNLPYPSKNSFFWTDAGCTQLVKVRDNRRLRVRCLCLFPSCQVSLKPELTAPSLPLSPQRRGAQPQQEPLLLGRDRALRRRGADRELLQRALGTGRVHLQGDLYPTLDNNCGEGACRITNDDACLCSVTLDETFAFGSLPSRDEVLSTLKIGAFDPATFASDSSAGPYVLLDSSADVEVWVAYSSAIGATSTVVRVVDEFGTDAFYENMRSDNNETFAFGFLPSRDQVLSTLKTGMVDPTAHTGADTSSGSYILLDSSNQVEAWVPYESTIGAMSTIFRVIDEFRNDAFFKNMRSDVTLGDLYRLRNMPAFMNLVKVELRDAEVRVQFAVLRSVHSSCSPALTSSAVRGRRTSDRLDSLPERGPLLSQKSSSSTTESPTRARGSSFASQRPSRAVSSSRTA